MTKKHRGAWLLALLLTSGACWSYGSGSSAKACTKPKFSGFTPAENAEVAPASAFAFVASPNTYPTTIKVTVKDVPVTISATPGADGIQVNGTLPATLAHTYARLVINAEGQNNCKGSGGWLLKIK
ncbi:MAG: hypothetical protein PHU14_15525 [Methylovulum sp.]|nr:hypothetical protein [Methylovulum sp.]